MRQGTDYDQTNPGSTEEGRGSERTRARSASKAMAFSASMLGYCDKWKSCCLVRYRGQQLAASRRHAGVAASASRTVFAGQGGSDRLIGARRKPARLLHCCTSIIQVPVRSNGGDGLFTVASVASQL